MGKWFTGILYLLTGVIFLIGWAYDFCTLNSQITEINAERGSRVGRMNRLVEG
jgi:hypothetical protein